MNKKRLLGFAFVFILGISAYFAYAYILLGQWTVLSCTETDAGFDYLNFGTNNGTAIINGTQVPFSVTDYCISNTTIGEFVCGSTYGQQYANITALVSEDCTLVPINATANATACVAGRCV